MALLESERLSAGGQARVKALQTSLAHTSVVFDELDFYMENGRNRPYDKSR